LIKIDIKTQKLPLMRRLVRWMVGRTVFPEPSYVSEYFRWATPANDIRMEVDRIVNTIPAPGISRGELLRRIDGALRGAQEQHRIFELNVEFGHESQIEVTIFFAAMVFWTWNYYPSTPN
jgi:hypothetical protein